MTTPAAQGVHGDTMVHQPRYILRYVCLWVYMYVFPKVSGTCTIIGGYQFMVSSAIYHEYERSKAYVGLDDK